MTKAFSTARGRRVRRLRWEGHISVALSAEHPEQVVWSVGDAYMRPFVFGRQTTGRIYASPTTGLTTKTTCGRTHRSAPTRIDSPRSKPSPKAPATPQGGSNFKSSSRFDLEQPPADDGAFIIGRDEHHLALCVGYAERQDFGDERADLPRRKVHHAEHELSL